MVIALLALALFAETAPQPQPAAGVVCVARGRVSSAKHEGEAPSLVRSGALLHRGATVETGASGWSELMLPGVGRVRLSAATRVAIEEDGLRLSSGRVWIQRADQVGRAGFDVTVSNAKISVARGASVIIDYTRSAGTSVVVRAGEASLAPAALAPVRIEEQQIATLPIGARSVAPARTGGRGIVELAELEAESGLGDLVGVRAFLLDRAAKSGLRQFQARTAQEIVRTGPAISGGDPANEAMESAIKAPPFFEEEVPPKGPNVRVEVTFSDQ